MSWQDRALCRRYVLNSHGKITPYEWDTSTPRARRICGDCPVRVDCLEWAMECEGGSDVVARDAMFGGLNPAERTALYRQQRNRLRATAGAA